MQKLILAVEYDNKTVCAYGNKKISNRKQFMKILKKLAKENGLPIGTDALKSYHAFAYSHDYVYCLNAGEFQEHFAENKFEDMAKRLDRSLLDL